MSRWTAGVYEQTGSGWRRVEWSRHSRGDLAAHAARRYQRESSARTGGACTWTAWYQSPAGVVVEVSSQGDEVAS